MIGLIFFYIDIICGTMWLQVLRHRDIDYFIPEIKNLFWLQLHSNDVTLSNGTWKRHCVVINNVFSTWVSLSANTYMFLVIYLKDVCAATLLLHGAPRYCLSWEMHFVDNAYQNNTGCNFKSAGALNQHGKPVIASRTAPPLRSPPPR